MHYPLFFCFIFCLSANITYGGYWDQNSTKKELTSEGRSAARLQFGPINSGLIDILTSALEHRLDGKKVALNPRTSLQQFIKKGELLFFLLRNLLENLDGYQNVSVHGGSTPLLTETDLYNSRPLVIVNEIIVVKLNNIKIKSYAT